MNKKVLVIDKMHPSLSEDFKRVGIKVDIDTGIDKENLIKVLSSGEYFGVVVRSKITFTKEIIESLKVKFIARAGAGIDNIDAEAAAKSGIEVINAPEGNRDAVGEHCVGMILSLLNNLRKADREVRKGVWDREGNRGFELKGKTVGILGFGYMGRSLAEKLSGFGCRIIAYDRTASGFGDESVEEVSFEEFKKETEILSIHIQLDEDNCLLIDANYLSGFEKLDLVINSARGELLVLKDLLDLLEAGKIRGAALDVLENEKLPTLSEEERATLDRLSDMYNVLFTPHIAGWTFESYRRINEVIVKKVEAKLLDF